MHFPSVRPPAELPREKHHGRKRRGPGRHATPPVRFDPVDYARYERDLEAAEREYNEWTEIRFGAVVGKPGFFSRHAAGIPGDWKMYFVSDAATLGETSLDAAAERFDRDWFEPPPDDLPPDICLITRDIDHAYLDLFFRDTWMIEAVRGYLDNVGFKSERFVRIEERERRDR